MERAKCWKEKILCRIGNINNCRNSRAFYWLVVIAGSACLVGCTTLKKAGIVGLAGGTGALAGTVLSGGAVAPILGATVVASVTDVVTEVAIKDKSRVTTMGECAPDNFWSLLGSLVEMGGWFLLLLILVPMILGWILPGPLEKKKKKDL